MKKWGHDELLYDLADHLSRPERMMWCDMPMERAGSIRPDILTINKSFTKPSPLIYEIKVTMSDFRADVTAGKWQGYLKYSCGVVFCVPKGLITKADLPNGCGLMVRSDNGWRTAKAPTLERMPEMPRDFWLKALMSGIEQEYGASRAKYARDFSRYRAEREHFSEDVQLCLQDLSNARRRIERLDADALVKKETYSKQLEQAKERAMEGLENREAAVSQTISELNEYLGIEIQQTGYRFARSRVQDLIDSLDRDKEVERLKRIIERLQDLMTDAMKSPLPD